VLKLISKACLMCGKANIVACTDEQKELIYLLRSGVWKLA